MANWPFDRRTRLFILWLAFAVIVILDVFTYYTERHVSRLSVFNVVFFLVLVLWSTFWPSK
jgi:hypothetical protein